MKILPSIAALTVLAIGQPQAPGSAGQISEAEATRLVASIEKITTGIKSDQAGFLSMCLASMKKRAPDMSYTGVEIVVLDALKVDAIGPATMMCLEASQRFRMMEPVASTAWPGGVTVAVSPKNITAPNIVKIVVTRDGAIVPHIASSLAQTEHSNLLGHKRTIGAGTVVFPISAFAPGGEVKIIAIPDVGDNLSRVLIDSVRRQLQ